MDNFLIILHVMTKGNKYTHLDKDELNIATVGCLSIMYLFHSPCFVNSDLGIHTFLLKLGTKRTVDISSSPQMMPDHTPHLVSCFSNVRLSFLTMFPKCVLF